MAIINLHTKFDTPLKEETKPNQTKIKLFYNLDEFRS